jgi:hypothetical protein
MSDGRPVRTGRYAVFISYRHNREDTRWAVWLGNELETYTLPKALVRQGLPAKIGRVFRDEDELPGSSDLSKELREALQETTLLVVICSPTTPASKWINQEISLFASFGKSDRILPVLVGGEKESSYPSSLKTLTDSSGASIDPIGADLREVRAELTLTRHQLSELKRHVILRIVAAIVNRRFDDLRRRTGNDNAATGEERRPYCRL